MKVMAHSVKCSGNKYGMVTENKTKPRDCQCRELGFSSGVYLDSCINLDKTLVYFTKHWKQKHTSKTLPYWKHYRKNIPVLFERREKEKKTWNRWKMKKLLNNWLKNKRMKEERKQKEKKKWEKNSDLPCIWLSPHTKQVQRPRPESQWRSGLPYVLALWPDPNSLLPLGPQSPHL